MKCIHLKKEKGMFTVEAVFIIPIMILMIFGIIYLSAVHYQNIVAVAEATRAANRVAAYWSYIGDINPAPLRNAKDIEASELITEDMYTERSPYRYLIETGSAISGSFGGISKRKDNGQKYADARISGLKFDAYNDKNGNHSELTTEVSFLSSYVTVSVRKKYLNPLGRLLEILGIAEVSDYSSSAKSLITSPSEFIRNVDMIIQIGCFLFDG